MLKENGFSLIEVVVVAAILSILAAIAIPNYTKYVTNARRADGKTALVAAAQAMERYYTNRYDYFNATTGDHSLVTFPELSDNEHYQLCFTNDDNSQCIKINENANKFKIKAFPVPSGKQVGDTLCKTMTINHLGQKTPATCW